MFGRVRLVKLPGSDAGDGGGLCTLILVCSTTCGIPQELAITVVADECEVGRTCRDSLDLVVDMRFESSRSRDAAELGLTNERSVHEHAANERFRAPRMGCIHSFGDCRAATLAGDDASVAS